VSGRIQRTNNGVDSFHAIFQRLVKVSHPSFYAFLEYLQEVAVSNMADVQRLNRGGPRTNPQTKKANLMNDKRILRAFAKYSSGSCTVGGLLEFVCSVSHCCDNVTQELSQNDDSGSSTDEYELDDVDDGAHELATASSSRPTASATVATASCDVCLRQNAPPVKVALLPCGHTSFCQECIDTLVATDSHCPVCRNAISSAVRFYN